ncbi:MAG: ABC transporter substrate-binding protein [Rhizobiales bacterium]|nr:ABC transporter substrate-binding protein [Hyphomicrobiales bacterium]
MLRAWLCAVSAFFIFTSASAQTVRGVTDQEIKIGQTWPYSGPVSGHAISGKTEAAYFDMINESGGINGRKLKYISYDDAFSPSKTVEQVRKLVEQDEVALIFGSFGTATNSAVLRYINSQKVPHLLLNASGDRFTDPKQAPWSTILPPSAEVESGAFASYILSTMPNAKMGVLYQNDDFGRLYLATFKKVLGAKAANIVSEMSANVTDPTVDSQIVSLHASGAEVLVDFTLSKQTAQALKKAYDLKWKAPHLVTAAASSIPETMKPAGLEKSQNVVAFRYFIDPSDPEAKTNPHFKKYYDFLTKRVPGADPDDFTNVSAYTTGEALVEIIKRCGNDLSPQNIIKQATSGEAFKLSLTLPGVEYRPTPENHGGITHLQPSKIVGGHYVAIGSLTR